MLAAVWACRWCLVTTGWDSPCCRSSLLPHRQHLPSLLLRLPSPPTAPSDPPPAGCGSSRSGCSLAKYPCREEEGERERRMRDKRGIKAGGGIVSFKHNLESVRRKRNTSSRIRHWGQVVHVWVSEQTQGVDLAEGRLQEIRSRQLCMSDISEFHDLSHSKTLNTR